MQQIKEGSFFDRCLYYHLVGLIEQVKWLEFIKDSLDGQMDADHYADAHFQRILAHIQEQDSIDTELQLEMKDEAAWEIVKSGEREWGRQQGHEEGVINVARIMKQKGFALEEIANATGLTPDEIEALS